MDAVISLTDTRWLLGDFYHMKQTLQTASIFFLVSSNVFFRWSFTHEQKLSVRQQKLINCDYYHGQMIQHYIYSQSITSGYRRSNRKKTTLNKRNKILKTSKYLLGSPYIIRVFSNIFDEN